MRLSDEGTTSPSPPPLSIGIVGRTVSCSQGPPSTKTHQAIESSTGTARVVHFTRRTWPNRSRLDRTVAARRSARECHPRSGNLKGRTSRVPRIVSLDEFLSLRGVSRNDLTPLADMSDAELATRLPEDEASFHRDETLFVRLRSRESDLDASSIMHLPFELWASLGSAGGAEIASLGRRNGLHFFVDLDSSSNTAPSRQPTPPRLLVALGTRERALPQFDGVFTSIEELAPRFRGWDVAEETVSFNRDTLLGAIRTGVDGIVFVAHGFRNAQDEPVVSFEEPTVGLRDIHEALEDNPRPLRFFFLMACNLFDPATKMLQSLADDGRLHPHFGGVLVRGAPDMAAGAQFTLATLDTLARLGEHVPSIAGEERALARRAPLAYAVQQGRRAVRANQGDYPHAEWAVEAARPRLVHRHPFSRPLPLALELDRELYLRSLADELGTRSTDA